MSKFPAAFPCAQPAPGPEARLPPLPPPQPAAPADTASLGLLADACLGLACDEDLGNSPFEALDDDDDSAVQQPVQAVVPPETDQDLAPVERMAAEADAALSRMSAAVTGGSDLVLVGCSGAHLKEESPTASEAATAAALPDTCDAESMWAAEAIAEADMLSCLEGAGSPVEAVAQLSLPMFPEAVTPPDTPVRGSQPPAPFAPGCASDPSADDVPSESAADSSSSQQLEQLASLIRRSSSEGMPGQRQVISGFEADLASNPAQLQRPCQRDVDSSFADKGRLREAASAPPTLDLADYLLDKGPCFQSSGAHMNWRSVLANSPISVGRSDACLLLLPVIYLTDAISFTWQRTSRPPGGPGGFSLLHTATHQPITRVALSIPIVVSKRNS